MKRLFSFALALVLPLLGLPGRASAEPLRDNDLKISAPSAVLMEKQTGELLYEKGAHERRLPASVTKVMTLLLIVEDVESGKIALGDTVTASARAASFGGSCVYLEEGEQMSVDEMLKCIAVVSANDCAVAMAEHLCGTEEVFVERMNRRAAELGMNESHFTNCTGLFEDAEHYTTAWDVALMSRELIRHELIKNYHGDSIESRNADAKALLNYAFANFTLAPLPEGAALGEASVVYGRRPSVPLALGEGPSSLLVGKGGGDCGFSVELKEPLSAPLRTGESVGELIVTRGGEELARRELVAAEDVERIGFWGILGALAESLVGL